MVEKYEPVPFEQRPSQNIGLKHYAHEIAPIVGLTALGGFGGWLVGKLGIIRQSPAITASLGAKATGLISVFLIWRKHEKKNLGIEEAYKELKTIEHLHLTDDDLRRDNRILKQMIEFEKHKSFAERVAQPSSTPDSPTR